MADYSQTHVVPSEGLPAWSGPDGSGPPAATLDPDLDVQVTERRGEWAHIRCSNGWEAWVDGRRLIEAQPAPVAPAPPPPTPQPAPTQPAPTAAPSEPATPSAAWGAADTAAAAAPSQPGPPSAAWSAPGTGPAAAPRAAGAFTFGPGQIVALVGGVLLFVSGWLTWIRFELSFRGTTVSQSYSAYKIPAHFLLDSQSGQGGLNLGIIILLLGLACIAGALISGVNAKLCLVSVILGGVAFLLVVIFLVQTKYLVNNFNRFVGYFDVVRFGAPLAFVGAIGSAVGGILGLVQKRS